MAHDLVVIGTSLGGTRALETLLGSLPVDFGLPVAVVRHTGRGQDGELMELVRKKCKLPVVEVEDKEPVEPGRVYFAPADYHLLVDGRRFALSIEAPVQHARPSIDVLFETAAESYGERVIGVVLTGSNPDGARGLAAIRKRGGYGIVQEPSSSESAIMPEAAIREAGSDQVLPLAEIGPCLDRMWRNG